MIPLRHRFGFTLSVLARQWRRGLETGLAHAGLTDATWAPLLHLQESGDGITQKELAVRVGIDGSSLVRLIDILVNKGFVERQVDEQDRRARLIYLTAEGREAVKEIRRILAVSEAKFLGNVTPEEIDHALKLFDSVSRQIREAENQSEDLS
mgnify:CR=1 FL=1